MVSPMQKGFVFLIATLMLSSCASKPREQRVDAPPIEPSSGEPPVEATTPRRTMSDVMQAKLAHAQAILEGMALGDFPQIEVNAADLHRISLASEWLVMETATYHGYSEEFRRVTTNLIEHARAKNLDQVTHDYAALTHTCISCHSYLRSERPFLNVPGRVSLAR